MPPETKRIVLIVDDEEALRKLNRLILERAGYGVLLAGNSQEALAISRGYCGQIHLLFSDVEMPGMNGIALCRQIADARPDIAVVVTSGNPCYAEETPFAFLAKPFSPENLKIAIAQALEFSSRPAVSTPAMPWVAATAAPVLEFPAARARHPVEQHSVAVLAAPERRLPETIVPIRWGRLSRWPVPRSVPVWAAAAALMLAIAPFGLHQINERRSVSPYPVSLQAQRGVAGQAQAPTGKTLLLNLDVASLPRSDSYEIQIVNGEGDSVWQKVVAAQGSEVSAKAVALRPGTYFVRVYGPAAGDLLKEYELRVTEKH